MEIKSGERIDDLQAGGLRIIQKKGEFCFGSDSVLLSAFAHFKKNASVIDLGAGSGAISFLLAAHNPDLKITALEINESAADRLARGIELNGISERVCAKKGDIRLVRELYESASFDGAISNPPYRQELGNSVSPPLPALRSARQEENVTIEDIAAAAGYLLRPKARLFLLVPSLRLSEFMKTLSSKHLEPKRVRFIHPKIELPSKLAMLELIKDGKSGLSIEPPLVMMTKDNMETEEVKQIYSRQ
ncbi:MAG: methyltransferase [Eubacteriales bacterium]|nr:methyltransferase [Eubacteriales bacterium]MDD3881994.1 methyltransferase [Eubacteriales bacterium]MDD4513728.1 methyltransferase [Eubacteriales bacterium]